MKSALDRGPDLGPARTIRIATRRRLLEAEGVVGSPHRRSCIGGAVAALAVLAIFAPPPAAAEAACDFTWIGGTGDWFDGANWSDADPGPNLPNAADDVCITAPGTYTVTIDDTDAGAKALTLGDGDAANGTVKLEIAASTNNSSPQDASLSLNADSTVASDAELEMTSTPSNTGLAELLSGTNVTLDNFGVFQNGDFTSFSNSGARAEVDLINHPAGVVLIDTDLIADSGATWENNGTFEINDRTLSVGGIFDQAGGSLLVGGDAALRSGSFNHSGGTTTLGDGEDGGSIEVAGGDGGLALTGGTLAGNGFIDVGTAGSALINSGGTVAPGGAPTAPGFLVVRGDYVQNAGATLVMQVRAPCGCNSRTQDILVVDERATLGGTIEVTTPEYTPALGQTFEIVRANPVTGTFDSVTGDPGLTVSYDPFGVTLGVAPPPTNPLPPPVADTTPPETTIVQAPRKNGRKRNVTFAFTSYEAASTFTCKLDDKPSAPCTSPFSAKVKRGKHTFSVSATDVAGNADPTPATVEFKVKKRKRKRK